MTTDGIALTTQDVVELLRPTLDAENSSIEDISVRSLTKPGDNYGSTMLAVDVTLLPGPRTLHLVAKMLPKAPIMRELFFCDITVPKETNLYLLVSPAYERLQRENNVPRDKYLDVFPLCYAARTSSKGSSAPVDETAIIVLENLKVQGFECGNRFTGLDLSHCKLVVDKLARFHATAVAMKIKKPEEFKATVLKAAASVAVGPPNMVIVKPFEKIPEYHNMKDRLENAFSKGLKIYNNVTTKQPREPFATLTHLDLWTNNIMFRYEPDSSQKNPTSLKLVDFQVTSYDSPARDLLFFLYSSAALDVLSNHYDLLVKLYHENFVDCLRILGCDTKPFSFDEFLKEMEHSSAVTFWHIAFMLTPINTPEKDVFNLDNVTAEQLDVEPKVGETYFTRASKVVSDFALRNWI